jgi:hypothetical protein
MSAHEHTTNAIHAFAARPSERSVARFATQPSEEIHLDTVSVTQTGFNGENLGMIITDDSSRARWSF